MPRQVGAFLPCAVFLSFASLPPVFWARHRDFGCTASFVPAISGGLQESSEKTQDTIPLDASQQRRIFDAVFRGPITELIDEVVRRSLTPRKRKEDEADYATRTRRCLNAMQFEIPLDDQSPKTDLRCRPTSDDCRRLATIGNAARITTGRALHHAVRIGHHLFRTVMMEILATSERTGASVRELLTTASAGNGICLSPEGDLNECGETPPTSATAAVGTPAEPIAAIAVAQPPARPQPQTPLSMQASDQPCTALSIPPQPMAKRAAATPSRENVTEERIEELEDRIDRLQETMQVLIESIDELRVELVHALRNLPDRLPPPLHIHSLPLDPTASDFGDRVNAIPQEVMDRLRAEAAGARRGESAPAPATAAEGNPVPAAVIDESQGNGHRGPGRQGTLFG